MKRPLCGRPPHLLWRLLQGPCLLPVPGRRRLRCRGGGTAGRGAERPKAEAASCHAPALRFGFRDPCNDVISPPPRGDCSAAPEHVERCEGAAETGPLSWGLAPSAGLGGARAARKWGQDLQVFRNGPVERQESPCVDQASGGPSGPASGSSQWPSRCLGEPRRQPPACLLAGGGGSGTRDLRAADLELWPGLR